jgi:hypothetical protein
LRVPGAPPRTSHDAIAPSGGQMTTVQPVGDSLSVQWPTTTSGTAVIDSLAGTALLFRAAARHQRKEDKRWTRILVGRHSVIIVRGLLQAQ